MVEDHERDPLPDFKPIVPLPEKVDVKTGEEGWEVCTFCSFLTNHRCLEWNSQWRSVDNPRDYGNEDVGIPLSVHVVKMLKRISLHSCAVYLKH